MAVALLAASLAGPALVGCSGGDDAGAARSTTTTATVSGTPGGRGAGDPYFPDLGNGGYDVEHYDLALTWHPDAGTLDGVATITATATQDLSRFDLDLSGLEVAATTVDGKPATTSRDAAELIVTPSRSIGDGHRFEVVVTYGGRPEPIHQGTDLFRVGWQTEGREAFVASEPAGAATFFPGNDHPSDKATYTFHITAPKDQVVATNGEPLGQRTLADGSVTWDSTARDPIATYLVQVAIGDYEVVDGGTSTAGVPIRHVLHRDLAAEARDAVSRTAQMMDVMSGIWGPYPFETYGVLAVDTRLDFALETQTLTLIGSDIAREGRDADVILVHELAHQWVGDAVSPATWKDIWLNEGFATYSEWLWSERTGGLSAAQLARRTQAEPGLDGPTADPGADELFQRTVYDRGALTLQALREEVGDDAFFRVLRTWVDEHGGRSASTADFTALAARVSGRDLTALFDRWLQQPAVPSLP